MPCLANRRRGRAPGPRCWSRCAPTPRGRRSSPTSTAPWRRSSSGPRRRRCRRAARELLARLSERYGLVGCVSGRRAEEARRLVGVDGIAYAGNHGLELLLPGDEAPRLDPSLAGRETRGGRLPRRARRRRAGGGRAAAGGQGPDPGAALARRRGRARAPRRAPTRSPPRPGRAGLEPRWGRKVLELRPVGGGGKDAAVAALLAGDGVAAAVYAGDDRTDLDAFRRLRELREEGELATAVCVGVVSAGGAAGAGRGVRPDRRRARRAGWRSSSGWRSSECPTPTCCASPSSSPAPRRPRWGRSRRSAPTATATTTTILRRRGLVAGRAGDRPLPRPPRARRRRRPRRPRPSPHRDLAAAGDAGPDRRSAASGRSALTAIVAGGLGIFFPGVAAIGAGYALLVSLAWHTREAAVLGDRAARRRQVLRRPQLRPAPGRAGPHPGPAQRSPQPGLTLTAP